MRTLFFGLLMLAVGCGNDKATPPGNNTPDAPAVDIDAPPVQPITLDCVSYCGANIAACTGELAQYSSMSSCLGACEHVPVGALTDDTGNTLGCRVYHTEFARQDAATHCEHSGPGGGLICGATLCESFCTVAPIICPTQWQAGTCLARCAALGSAPPYSINSMGNTQQCRMYHLTLATTDPATECPNTDRNASNTCM
jgi:hypothetical protein